jgi:lysophospholipase L1-like esterase
MDVVLLGHSYIRRLRDGLIPPLHSHRGQDVGIGSLIRAAQLASNLNISQHIRRVYTFSDGVVRIRDLDGIQTFVDRIRPGIVFIDIGSNDLAHYDVVDAYTMLQLVTQLTDLALSLHAPKIILSAILPRTGNITCSPDTFRENAELFNTYLMNICDPKSKLVYHKPRGFWNQYLDGLEHTLEVSDWSSDGIHCNRPDSFQKYKTRTRRAIMTQVHWASKAAASHLDTSQRRPLGAEDRVTQ